MSTIPAGLRADKMRKLIEDKATIKHVGGLYMGKFMDFQKEYTQELPPGDQYTVLNSIKGLAVQQISYQKLLTESFAGEITSEKLATGVIQDDLQADKKYIDFLPNSQKHNLAILFDASWSQPSAGNEEHQLYVRAPEIEHPWKKLPVKFDDGTGEPKKYYVLQYYANGESPVSTVCAYATLGILPGSDEPSSVAAGSLYIQRTGSPYASAPSYLYFAQPGDKLYFHDAIRIRRQSSGYLPSRIGYGSPNNLTWISSDYFDLFQIDTNINEEVIDDGHQFMVGVYQRARFFFYCTYKNGATAGDGAIAAERTESFTECSLGSLSSDCKIYYHDNITVTATMAPYAAGTMKANNQVQGVAPFGEVTSFSFLQGKGTAEQRWDLEINQIAQPRDISVYIKELRIYKSGDEYVERIVLRNSSSHPIRVVDLNGSGFNDFYDPSGSILLNGFKEKTLIQSSAIPPVIRPDRLVTFIFFRTDRGSDKLYYDQKTYPEIPE